MGSIYPPLLVQPNTIVMEVAIISPNSQDAIQQNRQVSYTKTHLFPRGRMKIINNGNTPTPVLPSGYNAKTILQPNINSSRQGDNRIRVPHFCFLDRFHRTLLLRNRIKLINSLLYRSLISTVPVGA